MGNSGPGDCDALTILSVALPLLTVGRGASGGAEEILGLLDVGLTQRGHRSIVVAARGSRVAGELIETPAANGEISDDVRARAQQIQQRAIEDVLQRETVDVVHFHGLDFLAYRPRHNTQPELVTLHLPIDWYPPNLFSQPRLAMNYVSFTQAQSGSQANVPVIPNGIDLNSFSPSSQNGGYLAWLGRVCPEKGVDIALRVAHRLNLPLRIAGPVHPFPFHQEYFSGQIRPLLDSLREYIGPVNAAARARFLSAASCLLIPSLVAETSSLVAMEAIASGTPVIAFRSGALPEIVDHGVTGFIVDSEEQMADAVKTVDSFSPEVCRSVAERRFSARRMVDDYIDLYHHLTLRASVG